MGPNGKPEVTIWLDDVKPVVAAYIPMVNAPILINDLRLALAGQALQERKAG